MVPERRPDRRRLLIASGALALGVGPGAQAATRYRVRPLIDAPIIAPDMDARMGSNIEGPSLIRAPDWLPDRLGRYYLYFADHKGDYIRLAYADRLKGPWKVHGPGALQLSQSGFPTSRLSGTPFEVARLAAAAGRGRAPPGTPGIPSALDDATLPHVASPDVHVDEAGRRIVMYYHGLAAFGRQATRVAVSPDGVNFETQGGELGPPYMRVFRHDRHVYGMSMPGVVGRSRDGFAGFERGPTLFEPNQRHSALLKRGDDLHVFWTRVGDAPERIYVSKIDTSGDWMAWKAGPEVEVRRPMRRWEGADLPVAPSYRSAVDMPVNQLRDPAIFEERGRIYLLYAVSGERGIAISELSRLS